MTLPFLFMPPSLLDAVYPHLLVILLLTSDNHSSVLMVEKPDRAEESIARIK